MPRPEATSSIPPSVATSIFYAYFVAIIALFGLVAISILPRTDKTRVFLQRPFLFLRCAVGALLSTWFFMIQYMIWSYDHDAKIHGSNSLGLWLQRTSLFEQAWSIVCTGAGNWWWSSYICTFTVIFTAIIWSESRRREIRYAPAYMLLGQMVAMSVAFSLFLVAMSVRPRTRPGSWAPLSLYIPLCISMATIYFLPGTISAGPGNDKFLTLVLVMHSMLLIPFLPWYTERDARTPRQLTDISFTTLYTLLIAMAVAIHSINTAAVYTSLPSVESMGSYLYSKIFSHPAQASISLDVVWVGITLICWWLMTGSFITIVLKSTVLALTLSVMVARYTGVDWSLVLSAFPILGLLAVGVVLLGINRIRKRNVHRRRELLDKMGISDGQVVPGTDKKPPSKSSIKTLVGFFHPYCDSGGGGERVLWSAIAYLQASQRDVVSMVYTGDFPAGGSEADKARIINNVKTRFSIRLDPATLHFIPLPSRHLISDGYYKRFTLLAQSLGSVYLAWEGLCGKNGLWGDIYLDSMGYAFTFPFARLIAGSTLTTGAYVHYPTVSTDMVKRVKARASGIEDGGASKSWLKRQIKLVYYRIFTSLYSTSLLFSEEVMTNSSWTQAHITNLINNGRQSTLASLLLLDTKTQEVRAKRGEPTEPLARCRVVFPPCDTEELQKLGKLDSRKREMVSLAQFRPEKEHSKQLYALAKLFTDHPEYRAGDKRVTLTLMGGTRDAKDQARASELRQLASTLGISENVSFLENAPWGEIVAKLGEASIGLNTMQDEHFGINIVEFMAAGLIPIVHASAGPLLDIVVPHNGQKTGFHGTDAESFAEAIHQALSLTSSQSMSMRKAARQLAREKFSQRAFEDSFEQSWAVLKAKSKARREMVDRSELDKMNRR